MNFKLTLITLSLTLAMVSCFQPKATQSVSNVPLYFRNQTISDTANSANISWRQFFTDSLLNCYIEVAMANNLHIVQADIIRQIQFQSFQASRSRLFPQVYAGAIGSLRKFGSFTMDGAGNATTEIEPGVTVPNPLPDYWIGFNANWEIDLWGKLANMKNAAKERYWASEAGRNTIKSILVSEIAYAYYKLIAFDNQLDIIEETLELQASALELLRTQKIAGATNELAIKQFEAQLLNSQALQFDVKQKIQTVENHFNFLLNRYPEPLPRTKIPLDQPIPYIVQEGLPQDMIKNRPELIQAIREINATALDKMASEKQLLPSLVISAGLGTQAYAPGLLGFNPVSIAYHFMGGLVGPLINRKQLVADFKINGLRNQMAINAYRQKLLASFMEVSTLLYQLESNKNMYETKLQEVTTLDEAIKATGYLFRTGRANYLEVLMVQKNSLTAKIDLSLRKEQYFDTSVFLYKAIGGGWK